EYSACGERHQSCGAIEWPPQNMHREEIIKTVDQVAHGCRMQHQWNAQSFGPVEKRLEYRIVKRVIMRIGREVHAPEAERPDAMVEFITQRLRMAPGQNAHRPESVFMSGNKLFDPVVVGPRQCRAQFAADVSRDAEMCWEQHLPVNAFALIVRHPPGHVPPTHLASRDVSAVPVFTGVVNQRMVEM